LCLRIVVRYSRAFDFEYPSKHVLPKDKAKSLEIGIDKGIRGYQLALKGGK
jgi:hypothetical protein